MDTTTASLLPGNNSTATHTNDDSELDTRCRSCDTCTYVDQCRSDEFDTEAEMALDDLRALGIVGPELYYSIGFCQSDYFSFAGNFYITPIATGRLAYIPEPYREDYAALQQLRTRIEALTVLNDLPAAPFSHITITISAYARGPHYTHMGIDEDHICRCLHDCFPDEPFLEDNAFYEEAMKLVPIVKSIAQTMYARLKDSLLHEPGDAPHCYNYTPKKDRK